MREGTLCTEEAGGEWGPPCPQVTALRAGRTGVILFVTLGPDTSGLQTGRVDFLIRVLLRGAHSSAGGTCAHTAGKGLPSPGACSVRTLIEGVSRGPLTCLLPHLAASGPEPGWGAETRHKAKQKSAPVPPTLHLCLLICGPAACCNHSLGAGLRNALERIVARRWVVRGSWTGLDLVPGGGPAPREGKPAGVGCCGTRLHPPPRSPGPVLGKSGLCGAGERPARSWVSPQPLSCSCVTSGPSRLGFLLGPGVGLEEGVCPQELCQAQGGWVKGRVGAAEALATPRPPGPLRPGDAVVDMVLSGV